MKPLTNEEMKNNPDLFYEQLGITGKMKEKMEKINAEWDSEEGMSIGKVSKILNPTIKDRVLAQQDLKPEFNAVIELPVEGSKGNTSRLFTGYLKRCADELGDKFDSQLESAHHSEGTITNWWVEITDGENNFYFVLSEDKGMLPQPTTFLTLVDTEWGGLRYGEAVKYIIEELKK